MKPLLKETKGSVTVYLIIVVSAIFLFVSVLIDFSRMKLAEHDSELAAKAGLRSIFSAYDRELRKYGLFGIALSGYEQQEIMHEIVSGNLSASVDSPFSLIRVHLQGEQPVHLKILYDLGNPDVFNQQVLEDMKYKAPVTFAKNVKDAFGSSSETVASAEHFVSAASEMEQLLDKREQQLDSALQSSLKLSEGIRASLSQCAIMAEELSTLQSRLQGVDKADLMKQMAAISRMEVKSEQAQSDKSRQLQALSQMLSLFGRRDALLSGLSQKSQYDFTRLTQQAQDIYVVLNQARSLDEQIQQKIEKMRSQAEHSDHPQAYEVSDHIEILGDDYFFAFKSAIGASLSALGVVLQMTAEAKPQTDAIKLSSTCQSGIARSSQWFQSLSVEADKRKSRQSSIKRLKNEQQKKAQDVFSEVEQAAGSAVCSSADSNAYRRLTGKNGLAAYYRPSTNTETNDFINNHNLSKNPGDFGMESIAWLSRMLNGIDAVRDRMYLDEYVLTYFNYRTLSARKEAVESWAQTSHVIHNQESEYVLYGLSTCQGNLSAAYAEMYSLRLAIRTVEALTDPKKAAEGHPLLIALTAIAEGSAKAYEDMKLLTQGTPVELSAKLKRIKLTYPDYLRLFLLQGGKEGKLARMMALIQLNTDRDLQKTSVYVQSKTATSVRLWFLPAIPRLLHGTGVVYGTVKGKQYEMETTAAFSY